MTRLVVDGKSLYIHRADYDIFDSGMFRWLVYFDNETIIM
jgi:hypothetical protein